jgi:predicted MFS family arabinose efflux permease
VALVAGWMQSVAQSWLVLQLTDSPIRLGFIGTLQFGPVLLFSVVSGALADRLPKRGILVGTQTAYVVYALVTAALVVTGAIQYWHVCVIAVAGGLTNALDMPTRQAFYVDMVGKDDVTNAVALSSAAFNAARIVGPALGGLLIARVGVAPAFLVNALATTLVVITLLRLRAAGRPQERPAATVRSEVAEGLRYARRTPLIMLLLGLLSVVSLCVFNFTVYIPLLARHVLGLGPEGFGYLMAALGVGAVAGALTVGTWPGRPPLVAMFATAALACTGLLGLGLVRDVGAAVPLLLGTGFTGLFLVASCNTGLQLAAPDELRGRIMSLYTLVFGGMFPIGAFLVGAISERWGVSRALYAGGVFGLSLLVVLFAWWARRSHRRPLGEAVA